MAIFAAIGLLFNIWLYLDDIRNRDGILNRVHKDDTLVDLMTSPPDTRRVLEDLDEEQLLTYNKNKGERDALKRSMAKNSMAQAR